MVIIVLLVIGMNIYTHLSILLDNPGIHGA